MIEKSYTEESYTQHSPSSCDLLVLLEARRLSFLVSNRQQQVLHLQQYLVDPNQTYKPAIEAIRKESLALRETAYRSITLGLGFPLFSIIPRSLFKENHLDKYLSLIGAGSQEESMIQVDAPRTLQVKNVYAFPEYLYQYLSANFPGFRHCHLLTALLNMQGQHAAEIEGVKIYIHVRERDLFISLFQGKELFFVNRFDFENDKDFLYFVMLIFRQFKLKPEDIPTFVSGELVADSRVYGLLYRYIKNLHFLPIPSNIQPLDRLKKEIPHLFFGLFALKSCAS